MKKGFKLFAAVLTALSAFVPAQAAELTVFEGNASTNTIPINVYWLDNAGTQTQVIYPAEALTEMVGRPINSMKFYTTSELDANGGTINVSLAIVDQVQFNINEFITQDMTQVATITMVPGGTELLITFDEPFIYTGGNLLLDTYVAEACSSTDYGQAPFRGKNPFYYASKSRTQLSQFIPMTTFDYTPAEYAAMVAPEELAFAALRVGNEEEMTVVVKNVGQNPFTPIFTTEAPFSINVQAVELAAGESMEVPVKFAPTTDGNFTGVMTVDCGEAGTFEVALSGKALPEADEFTFCDGDRTNGSLPVYGFYYDMDGGESQVIYPAETLADISGKEIIALSFYPKEPLAFYGGNVQFSLLETEQTAFESEELITGMTVVGNVVPERGDHLFTVYLDEPYKYNGGNLVIGTLVTEAGEYGNTSFYGVATSVENAFYTYRSSYSNYSNTAAFLPKVTVACKKGAAPETELGDVNNDGKVNISDVTELINYLLTDPNEAPAVADCNKDGKITISDVTELINYLLSGSWGN